ncbi:MAG: signal recognition particle protein [Gemmiger sp.]|nr:signal recognition particle protein [Gemmiger sp.]
MAFESLSERLSGVFKKLRGKGKLGESDIQTAMREVRMALLEADVNYQVAKSFCAKVSGRAMGQEVMDSLTPAQQVVKIVNEELTTLMGGEEPQQLRIKNKGQTVLMMCGLQGNGKTTHAAKLGKFYHKQGHHPLLVACDIYRPAAIDQLKIVGEQAGVPVFTLEGAKPEQIAQKALARAKDYGNDIVILDTAGRLQIDDALMDELVRIKQAVEVDDTLLVVDAMAGQEAVNVAKAFHEKIGVDGVILTKTDGDTRGGAALSVLAVTGKPIYFQGIGEKLDDLELFYPARMSSRILGMGDVLSLIEKAQSVQDNAEAEESAKRMMTNKFDMNDMLAQFSQIRKMGGASALLSMLPGGNQISPDTLDEKALPHIEAMIFSMTPAERAKPSIINPKRKRRIAAGSGQTVEAVNKLLRQFEMMQKMMKQAKRNPKGFMRRMGGMPGMGGMGGLRG